MRAVVNSPNSLISAQDYDAWGYLLDGRSYQSDESKFKFTGKERDKENNYDYFGARYYDARIANWTSIDPLMEKHYDFSPYNYVLRNPLILVDPDGRQTLVWEVIKNTAVQTVKIAAPLAGVSLNPVGIILGSLVNPSQLGDVAKYIEFIEEQRLSNEELYPRYTTEEIIVNVYTIDNSKGKHAFKIRTQENLRNQQGSWYKENCKENRVGRKNWQITLNKEILKISKEKANPLKEAAKKMKKLIEEQDRLSDK
ncbi:MAG: RHS repeat-associated core domain-containing protein [bacterium]|nr:RHS repeat-associated core domain-containing protein [bacterium]